MKKIKQFILNKINIYRHENILSFLASYSKDYTIISENDVHLSYVFIIKKLIYVFFY